MVDLIDNSVVDDASSTDAASISDNCLDIARLDFVDKMGRIANVNALFSKSPLRPTSNVSSGKYQKE